MKELKGVYMFNDGSLGTTTRYLGANVENVQLEDSYIAGSTTIKEYCCAAIDDVEKNLSYMGLDK